MLDFEYHIPTKFIFGKNSIDKVGVEISQYGKKVLIHHDGSQFLVPLIDKVKKILELQNLEVFELGGVVPNPRISLMEKGVKICKENKIDFVLAIGAGSVMDSAKTIAFWAENEGDILEYVRFKKVSSKCLPLGTIVTMPGTGSEISNNAMIVDDRTEKPFIKHPLYQESFRYKFAIMNPELTYTLPYKQTVSGGMDILSHTMERYFNGKYHAEVPDMLSEANLIVTMKCIKRVIKNPKDYDARANLMFACTVGHSNLFGQGVLPDWCVHQIENPITVRFNQTHGTILAIMTIAWMKYIYKRDIPKFAQFATRVMGANPDFYNQEETAYRGIELFENFVKEIGLPTRLSDINVREEHFESLAEQATTLVGQKIAGAVSQLTKEEIIEVYKLAC